MSLLFSARAYKIFVSGVYSDITDERAVVSNIVPRFGHVITDLRKYPTTAAAINDSDVFLLITGSAYGQIVIPDYGAVNLRGVVSVVEAEFRYAATRRKQILAFVRDGYEREEAQELFVRQVQSRLEVVEPYLELSQFIRRLETVLRSGDLLDPPRRVRLPMFVSYSHADQARIHALIDVVQNDVPVWIDRDQLVPGQNLPDRIRDAIVRAGFVLSFLSPSSVTGRGCRRS